MFRSTLTRLILAALVGTLTACVDNLSSEELPLTLENGQQVCEGPKKVLICHIPPGNPDNAHEICVGEPAVAHHVANHGDNVGLCDPGEEPPPVDEADAAVEPPPEEPPADEDPDAGVVIVP